MLSPHAIHTYRWKAPETLTTASGASAAASTDSLAPGRSEMLLLALAAPPARQGAPRLGVAAWGAAVAVVAAALLAANIKHIAKRVWASPSGEWVGEWALAGRAADYVEFREVPP